MEWALPGGRPSHDRVRIDLQTGRASGTRPAGSISAVNVEHIVIRFARLFGQHHRPVTAAREVRNDGKPDREA